MPIAEHCPPLGLWNKPAGFAGPVWTGRDHQIRLVKDLSDEEMRKRRVHFYLFILILFDALTLPTKLPELPAQYAWSPTARLPLTPVSSTAPKTNYSVRPPVLYCKAMLLAGSVWGCTVDPTDVRRHRLDRQD